ncbi:MAG: hypothetical protein QXF56_04570 [Candidatus Micrarchaeia archaeon]
MNGLQIKYLNTANKITFVSTKQLTFLLIISLAAAQETALMIPGEQLNFSFGESTYPTLLVGLTRETATFIISGARVAPGVGETKILDLTEDGIGDIGITLDNIMGNSTVMLTVNFSPEGSVCKQINSPCAESGECCVGRCIAGACNYPPTPVETPTVAVELDAPENVTPGEVVNLKITREDGAPVSDAIIDVVTPSEMRLTFITNETGEGSFLAAQEGVYQYVVYNYVPKTNRTTLSSKPLPPEEKPPAPFCGDGTCNAGETCSSCPRDCGACPKPVVETAPPQQQKAVDPSWPMWLGAMLLSILLILRLILPVFIKD